MKMVKMIIDNKEIEVQLTDEQVKELTTSKKVTGFERAEPSQNYYYFAIDEIGTESDERIYTDDCCYETANYYTDKELAEWCVRSDTLTRRMRRWAAEHNTMPISLDNGELRWYIVCSTCANIKSAKVNFYFSNIEHGQVYFETQEIAEAAIKEFGDEIKWLAENRPMWF